MSGPLTFDSFVVMQVLVDGPQSVTGIHRQVITLKRLSLTDVLVARLPRNATQKNLTKAWTVRKKELLTSILKLS